MKKNKSKKIIPPRNYKKLWRIMKLSLVCLWVETNMLLANQSYTQETAEIPSISHQQPGQTNRQISGTIVDVYGEPIIGANVLEKGTTNGASTDMDGNFKLSIGQNGVLQISYLGFVTQDIETGNQTTFNITMEEDMQVLSDVVVVGYASQKKVNLTGSVASIDFSDEKLGPVPA